MMAMCLLQHFRPGETAREPGGGPGLFLGPAMWVPVPLILFPLCPSLISTTDLPSHQDRMIPRHPFHFPQSTLRAALLA